MNATAETRATTTADSRLLGPVEVAPENVFEFDEGLLGFPEARRFVLLPAEARGLFWLQSLEHDALTFLLLDPFLYVDGFSVELGVGELRGLGGAPREALAVLSIVTLPSSAGATPTANLQGPVVFQCETGRARQVVLPDSSWGIHWPVDLRPSESATS